MSSPVSTTITAANIMTHNPICIGIETKLEEITDLFTSHKISSLPVLTENGIPIGALSEVGLVKILIRSRNKKKS